MPVNPERIHRLADFGLTDYQARVYLALLDLGTATAKQVPPHARVPRTRVYTTMAQLNERGLVEILPESPLRYKPVPFSTFLAKLAAEHKDTARRLEAQLPALSEQFAVSVGQKPEGRGRFEAIHGRRNAREKLVKMYSAASRTIVGIGTVNSPGRIQKALASHLQTKWKAGVQIRYAFPVRNENREDIRALMKFAEIHDIDFLMPVYLHVVDSREFIMANPIPDDESFYRGEDIAIWSDDPAIAEAIMRMSERIWSTGSEPKEARPGRRKQASRSG